MIDIKKAIIPVVGTGVPLFPFSKILPKEFLPLADKPAIQYIVEEIKAAGIKKIVFITKTNKKEVLNYFKHSAKTEKILKDAKEKSLLNELEAFYRIIKNLSFSSVVQKEPLGYGYAVFQAKKLIGNNPCAVLLPDDIIDSVTPCTVQLSKVFKTCQKPVVALRRISNKDTSPCGTVRVEKIASRLYKIKKIISHSSADDNSSEFAIAGRYILTPEAMSYIQKFSKKKPLKEMIESGRKITLAESLDSMLQDGKIIYGYEVEGNWLRYHDKPHWFKSNMYFSLKHPKFGEELKRFLEQIKTA